MPEPALALFDFDGTLTRRDSLFDCLAVSFGRLRLQRELAAASPMLFRYAIGRITNHLAKEALLGRFLAGLTEAEWQALCTSYSERIPGLLRPGAAERLRWHADEGHRIAIVSASPGDWIRAWAEPQGIAVIATELERADDRLTGRFAGANCHGKEKVRRIRQAFDLDTAGDIHAYGDTPGDLPMLRLASHAYWKPFRDGQPAPTAGLPT